MRPSRTLTVGVLIIPQVAGRGRVPHRGGAAVGGVILLQGAAVVAAVLQGLALLKVELAVVGAQIPGKPLIRDVVGALDQLAALAGAGVVAVKFGAAGPRTGSGCTAPTAQWAATAAIC